MSEHGAQRNGGELNSWKEIADYLGVTVRTAQRWEDEKGLPVRRVGGEHGRVAAEADDLARWKRTVAAEPRWWSNLPLLRAYAAVTTVVLILILAAVGIAFFRAWRKGPPAEFSFRNSELVVTDRAGRELWRHTFADPPYTTLYDAPIRRNWVWFGDVDGDHSIETVIGYAPAGGHNKPWKVYCFSARGEPRWEFTCNRAVTDAQRSHSPPYHLRGLRVFPSPKRDGRRWVVISSVHHWDYPCQIAVLDSDGRVVGEYWHSGHLASLETADLYQDGIEEILLAGVNNGRRQATLVVLDPRRVTGASVQPEGDPLQLQGFAAGSEKAVVLFPRTEANRKLEQFNVADQVDVVSEGIRVQVKEKIERPHPFLVYELDHRLNVKAVESSLALRNYFKELKATGQLAHAFTDADLEDLRRAVRLLQR